MYVCKCDDALYIYIVIYMMCTRVADNDPFNGVGAYRRNNTS